MKKTITLFTMLALGISASTQVVFQSDLSSWSAGDPTDFMGTKTNIPADSVVEQTVGVTYGTSMVSLINTQTSHERFTTQNVTVIPGETYEIEMWVAGTTGDLRTGLYDVTNDAYNTYNPYLDMSVESAGSLVYLTQTVVAPAGCTSAQFILSLKETDPATDGAPFFIGILLDSICITQIVPVPPAVTTIYDIQYTVDSSGDSPENGNVVTTYGIVTGIIEFGADSGNFFIQDGNGAWNGIYVYEDGYTLALGDSVEVTGTVQEYFGLTEIGFVTNVTVVNSGNAQPTPAVVTTLAAAEEQYESVLVQVTNATCTNADAGFGQWTVNDGSGDRLIDDQIYSYTPTLNNVYAVTGVTMLSFSEVKIYPRISADITVQGFASIEENNSFEMYPNPASEFINLNVQADDLVSIYSITGELVVLSNGEQQIDISSLEAGFYLVQITRDNELTTLRLIVE